LSLYAFLLIAYITTLFYLARAAANPQAPAAGVFDKVSAGNANLASGGAS